MRSWPAMDEIKMKHMLLLFSFALESILNAPCGRREGGRERKISTYEVFKEGGKEGGLNGFVIWTY